MAVSSSNCRRICKGKLNYIHHSGGGFSEKQMVSLFNELKKLEIKKTPFVNEIDLQFDTPMHFVKPLLVGQFKLSTKTTPSGKIRHPLIFVGLRKDKKASSIKSG